MIFARTTGLALCGACIFLATASSTLADVVSSGSTFTDNSGNFFVGYTADGDLKVNAGSSLSNPSACLGYQPGSTGTATVTDPGSIWTTNNLVVGNFGIGLLDIENGGQVSSPIASVGGFQYPSTVTVAGQGSAWNVSQDLYLGNEGNAALKIQSGGQLNTGNAYVGCINDFTSTATISGAGSTWTSTGNICVGAGLNGVPFGFGVLNIQGGAQVQSAGGYFGTPGNVNVTGPGTSWTVTGQLDVTSSSGVGELSVSDGATVTAQSIITSLNSLTGDGTITAQGGTLGDTNLVFDKTQGLTLTIPFGSGGTLHFTATPACDLGIYGTGTLRIAGGLTVPSNNGIVGSSATITDAGTTWNIGNLLHVSGPTNILSGGQVVDTDGYIYYGPVTVSGAGSAWINRGTLQTSFGDKGSLQLVIQEGAQVSDTSAVSENTALVTGAGSKWANLTTIQTGWNLTVSDGGQVTAQSLTVGHYLNLHVSGNDMVVLGDSSTVGSLVNKHTIAFYADPMLSPGIYTPISEYAERPINWSDPHGNDVAVGGVWDNTAHTFTVSPATNLVAGAPILLNSGQRLLIGVPGSTQGLGISFGTVPDGTTFSTTPASSNERAALLATRGFAGSVAGAWDFSSNYSGEALLSLDIGNAPFVNVWQLEDGIWQTYEPTMVTYDSNGILSFAVDSLTSYAVEVPEPVSVVPMVIGGMVMLSRRRKRQPASATGRE